jgi:phosphoglycerate dehydrogenase-like enzyme
MTTDIADNPSSNKPIVAITHDTSQLNRFWTEDVLDELKTHATVRVVGSKHNLDHGALHDVDYFLGSWGMPRLDEELLAATPSLKAVFYAAGSVKNFVTDASYERGVKITTAMHHNAVPVAEWCLGLILLINKDFFRCEELIRQQQRDGFAASHTPSPYRAWGNYHATVGLVSFGAVACELARLLQQFDLKVIAYDPFADAAAMAELGVTKVDTLLEVAQQSDILSLHAPNIDACANMMNKDIFAAMPDGAAFINTARGRIVNEDDLIKELQTGRIQAYLDVTFPEPPEEGHPFYELPNCYLTPHRAGSYAHEIRRMGRHAVDECLRFIRGDPIISEVSQSQLATMA